MSDRIIPCLWFNANAEEAVAFYTDLIPNSRITEVHRFDDGSPGAEGQAMMITFQLDGRRFSALNGGIDFPFSEAVSLVYACDDQAEIDRVWDRIEADGGQPQQCGWIKDRFGMPWQIVPARLEQLMSGSDRAAAGRVMAAVMQMVKIDLQTLEEAHAA